MPNRESNPGPLALRTSALTTWATGPSQLREDVSLWPSSSDGKYVEPEDPGFIPGWANLFDCCYHSIIHSPTSRPCLKDFCSIYVLFCLCQWVPLDTIYNKMCLCHILACIYLFHVNHTYSNNCLEISWPYPYLKPPIQSKERYGRRRMAIKAKPMHFNTMLPPTPQH